jgi:hypothetical protein
LTHKSRLGILGCVKSKFLYLYFNPDTGEYEFVLTLDTTTLTDGSHTIQATAVPEENGTNTELKEITLFAANNKEFNTWYVDCSAADDSGDGSRSEPWKTLGRALGTEWETRGYPHADSGDSVLLLNDTCEYDLPEGRYGDYEQSVCDHQTGYRC